MPRTASRGNCRFCGKSFDRSTMTRHLQACPARKAAQTEEASRRGLRKATLLHLKIEGAHAPEYWVHVEIPADATLVDLDHFLRDTWVECCGHLSQFKIGTTEYQSNLSEDDIYTAGVRAEIDRIRDFLRNLDTPDPLLAQAMSRMEQFPELSDMQVPLSEVLPAGTKFTYEYDFGSTTELTLTMIGERAGKTRRKLDIDVMARNDPPKIMCGVCGARPATVINAWAAWDEASWMCDECAKAGDYDEEGFLPVVNSPRVGVCGYTGRDSHYIEDVEFSGYGMIDVGGWSTGDEEESEESEDDDKV